MRWWMVSSENAAIHLMEYVRDFICEMGGRFLSAIFIVFSRQPIIMG